MTRRLITLTTDFGLADHFVGVMKGVILNINPEVQIVDLNHHISSFDILDGALMLGLSYRFFPAGTIHVIVVDPGVGSQRRPIVARAAGQIFVAPDNGVLSCTYDREDAVEVRHITSERYFLHPRSNTFHGRDIFAPVASWISRGVPLEDLGKAIEDYVRIAIPRPQRASDWIRATILKIDKFGNLLTSVSAEDIPELKEENRPFKIVVNGGEITRLTRSFAEGGPGELFAYFGSTGFLEIAVNQGSAAGLLNASAGTEIAIAIGTG